MKKIAFSVAMVAALVFAFGTAVAAPPEKIVIKEIQKVKGPVPFPHKAHGAYAKDCQTCHHADAAGKEQGCSKCHGAKTEGKKLALKDAFHKQCKECHAREKKGPSKCDDCHQKK